ncbi:MAG: MOSC domain-containing protein [Bacteroidota bacterium]
MSDIATMKAQFAQLGRVAWIGLRPARKAPMEEPEAVAALEGRGLDGDRAAEKKRGGKRQVTLIMGEHLDAAAAILGQEKVDPGLVRRNIVTRGINLLALKEGRVRIGEAVLEFTGPCHPCSRMEKNLGKGGYNAMRGHGGWCAKVISGGEIRLGDAVEWMELEKATE